MVSSKSILSAKLKIFRLDCIFSPTFNKGSSFYNFSIDDFLSLAYFYLGSLNNIIFFPWIFNSVAQSCPTLCDPVDCSTPGFPALHHLPELALTTQLPLLISSETQSLLGLKFSLIHDPYNGVSTFI